MEDEEKLIYGKKVGNLIQFGNSWIDLDRIEALSFTGDEDDPEDLGVEIQFKHSRGSYTLDVGDAQAFLAYFKNYLRK